MSGQTTSNWTDATWNPVRGCTGVSPGCDQCYAASFARRFRFVPGHPFEHGFAVGLVPEALPWPFSLTRAKRIFVNSMSDLFHEKVPDDYIAKVARVMTATPWHTYQVMTRRAARLAQLLGTLLSDAAAAPNIWWGVSVEDRHSGLPRIDHLRAAPAAVRFLSVEPLLQNLGKIDLAGIHWVIVGGETGRWSRPMEEKWVISIRNQCERAGVPFYFKQWGGSFARGTWRWLRGRTHDDMPTRGPVSVPGRAERQRLRALTLGESSRSPLPLLDDAPGTGAIEFCH